MPLCNFSWAGETAYGANKKKQIGQLLNNRRWYGVLDNKIFNKT